MVSANLDAARVARRPAPLINSEAARVMALMRQNARWARAGQLDMALGEQEVGEGALFGDLVALRRQLFSWRDFCAVSPVLYLAPFLEVVRSAETSGPITGAALAAVHKFTSLGLVDSTGAFAADAMHAIVDAVTHCRFEATDAVADEAVLVRILQTLSACVQCGAGQCISDADMSSIVQACFRIGHQQDGGLLRRLSCSTLLEIVRCVYARLETDGGSGSEEGAVASAVAAARAPAEGNGETAGGGDAQEDSQQPQTQTEGGAAAPQQQQEEGAELAPAAEEIFSFMCNLAAHADDEESDELPLLGLSLINAALESCGESVRNAPGLVLLVQTALFPALYRLGLSPNALVLSQVCSIVFNLYVLIPEHIKTNMETFVTDVLLRVADGKASSYNQQEVAVEALVDLCRQPNFMPDMFANYDCDLQSANVFEAICTLLSKNAFPVSPPLRSVHLLSLEGLLVVTHSIADRCSSPTPDAVLAKVAALPQPSDATEYINIWNSKCDPSDPVAWVSHLRAMKYYKRRMVVGTDHFNRDPKKGFEFLQQINLLPKDLDPQSVANFFRYTPGLSKAHLGEYLGDPDDFKVAVLSAFVDSFDFAGQSVDAALRSFLESFRLPGEAQKIARILEIFARKYFEATRGDDNEWRCLKNEDAAYVLSYSIIMLNTDLWSSQVKKKMTLDQFVRNNRQINDGDDIPRELLVHVYEQIQSCEIKMQSETTSASGTGSAGGAHDARPSPLVSCALEGAYDRDIFGIVWGPAAAAITAVYDMTQDEDVLRSMLDGFLAIAEVAAHYGLHDVVDNLVVSLCRFTAVLNPLAMPDKPAVVFGRNTKARMATVTVFSIASRFGDCVQGGWKNILDCILRLHKLGLLPPEVTQAQDFPDASTTPAGGSSDRALPEEEDDSGKGIFGRFAMFLTAEGESSGADSDARGGPVDEEAQERTARCVEALRIDELFADTKFMQNSSLLYLARSLVWASGQAPGEGGGGGSQGGSGAPADEDIAEVCLSLLLAITLRNRDRIGLLWPLVHEHVAGIIVDARRHTRLVERAVLGLLHLCSRLLPYKEDLADELLRSLQYVIKLDADIAWTLAGKITVEVRGRACVCARSLVGVEMASERLPLCSAQGRRILADFTERAALHPLDMHADNQTSMTLRARSALCGARVREAIALTPRCVAVATMLRACRSKAW